MKIKIKIALGLFFMFLVILLLWGLGSFYIRSLGNETDKILKDNYKSVRIADNLTHALRELSEVEFRGQLHQSYVLDTANLARALETFQQNLKLEENNITETGEKEVVTRLRKDYNDFVILLKEYPQRTLGAAYMERSILPALDKLQHLVDIIREINMQAIERKSIKAQATAKQVYMSISVVGCICFLFTLVFIVNFPGYVANPIQKLTDSIREIANKNYSERLFFKSKDEFGEVATAFNEMAQKLNDYESTNLSQILFQKKRIETIINTMKDPIIGLDEHKQILFVNNEAIKLLGLSPSRLIGRHIVDASSDNMLLKAIFDEMQGLWEQQIEIDSNPIIHQVNGKSYYFNKEILEVITNNQDGLSIVGYVIILKNITKYKELDMAKTNFLATVTHEFKTPISSIQLSLKLLEDSRVGTVNEEQRRLIEHIQEDSRRLNRITAELLDLAQIESGHISMQSEEVDSSEIVDYAVQSLEVSAESKNIKMVCNIGANLPRVMCDFEKTAWVVINILSNAIRFSSENSRIEIRVVDVGAFIEFSVRDFGTGFDLQYKDKIFDRFFRVPGNTYTSSTGLGLAICKEFIHAQNGDIRVDSQLGEGTCFSFTLPKA
jgi:PAS domain S-box-containing protein